MKLFLLSGAGEIADETDETQANSRKQSESTQLLAALIEAFISTFYEDIDIRHFYSSNDSYHCMFILFKQKYIQYIYIANKTQKHAHKLNNQQTVKMWYL